MIRTIAAVALATATAPLAGVSACGLIGDAGSSGTRIYVVYGTDKAGASPKIETVAKQKGGGLAKIGARK